MSLPGGAGHLDLAHCGALAGCVGSKLHSQSIASDENLPCISGDVLVYVHKYRYIVYICVLLILCSLETARPFFLLCNWDVLAVCVSDAFGITTLLEINALLRC